MTTTTTTNHSPHDRWVCEYHNGEHDEAQKRFKTAQEAYDFAKAIAQESNHEASVFNEPMGWSKGEWMITFQPDVSTEFSGCRYTMMNDLGCFDDIKQN